VISAGSRTGNIHAFLATPANQSIASRLQTSHLHTRNPICLRMPGNSMFRDLDSFESVNKKYFRSFRTTHSGQMLRERALPKIMRLRQER
jgi:hypothetical protein